MNIKENKISIKFKKDMLPNKKKKYHLSLQTNYKGKMHLRYIVNIFKKY